MEEVKNDKIFSLFKELCVKHVEIKTPEVRDAQLFINEVEKFGVIIDTKNFVGLTQLNPMPLYLDFIRTYYPKLKCNHSIRRDKDEFHYAIVPNKKKDKKISNIKPIVTDEFNLTRKEVDELKENARNYILNLEKDSVMVKSDMYKV